MKCFYHSADLDGHCSGFIVKIAHPEAELIGINYGEPFPWDEIRESDEIVMVDFALQPYDSEMTRLLCSHDVTWIDHHKTAAIVTETCAFKGVFRVGIGACALCWEYYFPEKPLPTFVKLLAEYDIWNHSDPRTLPFQYGMRQFKDTWPDNQDLWHSLFDVEEVHRICGVGQVILDYQNAENEKYAASCAFETELDGLKCIAINKMLTNSKVFDYVWNPEEYHMMLSFGWRKGKWTVILYSTRPDVDCSVIAKSHGGGGHKGASGFQCKDLPFRLG